MNMDNGYLVLLPSSILSSVTAKSALSCFLLFSTKHHMSAQPLDCRFYNISRLISFTLITNKLPSIDFYRTEISKYDDFSSTCSQQWANRSIRPLNYGDDVRVLVVVVLVTADSDGTTLHG